MENNKLRYILYARKSTEDDDRQKASIESQIEEMTQIAMKCNLKIVKTISESVSGYKRGRGGFGDMISMLKNDEADGILCWKLSRLSRNPDDAGIIMGMIQRGEIEHIKTYDKDWYPDDNALVMYVEFGLTNQFSRDLGTDTKRGLRAKAERGWYPASTLPLGYLHNPIETEKKKSDEEIINDPIRFQIIKDMLKKLAEQKKPPIQVFDEAVKRGLRTKRGKIPSESVLYRIATHPFYFGEFEFTVEGKKKMYKGRHEAMITKEEHEQILKSLRRGHVIRQQRYVHAFTGLMRCGECGCAITGDPVRVKIAKNGNVHKFKYYHCTKKRGKCSQPCIREEEINSQIENILKRIHIPENLIDLALKEVQEECVTDKEKRENVLMNNQEEYKSLSKKLQVLTEKNISGVIDDEEYVRMRDEIKSQMRVINSVLTENEESRDIWMNKVKNRLSFAERALDTFRNGSIDVKKSIITELGTNITILNKKVYIDFDPILKLFINKPAKDDLEQIFARTNENTDYEKDFNTFLTANSTWGGRWDLNPQPSVPQTDALTN